MSRIDRLAERLYRRLFPAHAAAQDRARENRIASENRKFRRQCNRLEDLDGPLTCAGMDGRGEDGGNV